MPGKRIDFERLAAALLECAESILPPWLPGRREGHEWTGLRTSAGGPGDSWKVNLHTGEWGHFASGARGGDLTALYKEIHACASMREAALAVMPLVGWDPKDYLGHDEAPPVQTPRQAPVPVPETKKPARQGETWVTIRPVPDWAPAATFKHHHRKPEDITHVAEYRIGAVLEGYVVRFRTSDGGKETLPYTWCQSETRGGTMAWRWRKWDDPAPLFHARKALPEGRIVLVVEGERCAEALQAWLDEHLPELDIHVITWPGGANRWHQAAWVALRGHTVLLWPDCDSQREPLTRQERAALVDAESVQLAAAAKPYLPAHKQPGMAAMVGIAELLRQELACTARILDIPGPGDLPDGWDCVDAIEKDDWTASRMQTMLDSRHPLDVGHDGPAAAGQGDAQNHGDGGREMPGWLLPFWDAGKARWMVSRKLVIRALEGDPALAGVVAFNELTMSAEAVTDWPWLRGSSGPLQDATDLMLDRWFSEQYGLPSISRQALEEGILSTAYANRFHPVRDWLQSLKGATRDANLLDHWLIHALGYDENELEPLLLEYLQLVGRYWVLGIVNRVMRPGCKFDYCPVLEGKGGLRKSTLIEVLVGSKWYSDTHFDLTRGKEGQEQVQGIVLYELAELSVFSRGEMELIKAFISAKVDRYRAAYGRTVSQFPRQCIFAGTTNKKDWLRDRTGNRRWWPIPVLHRIDTDWVEAHRDQIFAEAYAAYLEGTRYSPSQDEEDRLFIPQQEARLADTAVTTKLLEVLTRAPSQAGIGAIVHGMSEFLTLSQIVEALGVDSAKSTPALESQVRDWLYSEGWVRLKKQSHGVRAWGMQRPKDWPAGDKEEPEAAAASPSDDQPIGGADDDTPF